MTEKSPPLQVGALWATLHVDGVLAVGNASWQGLPIGRWAHVHVTTSEGFRDDLTVFGRDPLRDARVIASNGLKGAPLCRNALCVCNPNITVKHV
eukprot:3770759-Pyramimonas_sp.AAC.1